MMTPFLPSATASPVARPSLIGSQGLAGLRPENTLAAIRHAIAVGIDGVELDFHLSADGVLVAHHNYRLNPAIARRPDGRWLQGSGPPIKSLTYAELQDYDVGRAVAGSYPATTYPERRAVDGERIPSLEAVFQLLESEAPDHMEVWIEIKSNPLGRPHLVTPAAAYLAALVDRLNTPHRRERACVIAFDWAVLQGVQARLPGVRTGYLTVDPKWISDFGEEATGLAPEVERPDRRLLRDSFMVERHGSLPRAVASAGGSFWSPFIGDLTPDLARQARSLGLGLASWGADSDEAIAFALSLELDSITNSRPDLLQACLAATKAP